jgi:hypothetical protein
LVSHDYCRCVVETFLKIKIGRPNGGSGGVPTSIARNPLVSPFEHVMLPPSYQGLLVTKPTVVGVPTLSSAAVASKRRIKVRWAYVGLIKHSLRVVVAISALRLA